MLVYGWLKVASVQYTVGVRLTGIPSVNAIVYLYARGLRRKGGDVGSSLEISLSAEATVVIHTYPAALQQKPNGRCL